MLQNDYILRVAEDVDRTLAQIISHQDMRDYQGALSLIDEVCRQAVGTDSDFIHAISEETLLAMLTLLGVLDVQKTLLMAKYELPQRTRRRLLQLYLCAFVKRA